MYLNADSRCVDIRAATGQPDAGARQGRGNRNEAYIDESSFQEADRNRLDAGATLGWRCSEGV
jgi:hypothetical protein